ncbi:MULTISPECIES: hypothetical protein [Aneurinibacillus]|uniref:Uncharacterized protein n=1 Tax=Aneurinibacillus thermoaerophilus TaxID=143495 RepID=A0ABX8Y6T7_ANETH|nr:MULTISPECIES: hypothetical protein [Aneurinibacillus]MED0677472.1 hypothetical protein [Aneurinibacillus thermoaerophilus]MED0681396.1 hypothetical protein [Aneurinibacillus thermoaerophilus]MED0735878.1 hypothetical protein [Aneurinibacillus thermoaerophilus]MED0759138.1 hypothetical protein [Aneurinibacillus thermoaerophilus]MED0762656.1 hypothetical protein [Aneurinibacillus thermoaerophilus]
MSERRASEVEKRMDEGHSTGIGTNYKRLYFLIWHSTFEYSSAFFRKESKKL